MGTVTTFTFTSDTETVTRTKLNNLVSNLVTEFNGNITNANVSASAAIAASKLDLSSVSQAVTFSGNTLIGAANQGDVLYDNGTTLTRLTPGTSGYSLVTQGASSNPLYRNVHPIGAISLWGTTSAPTDYLLCDGTAVSRTTYSALFTLLSTTYGVGDGSTTFNLPNLKGKVPVGYNASETEFDSMGETGGEKTHTIATPELPSHTHSVVLAGRNANGWDAAAQFVQGSSDAGGSGNITFTSATAGSGTAMNVLQPYITLTYIIRYR